MNQTRRIVANEAFQRRAKVIAAEAGGDRDWGRYIIVNTITGEARRSHSRLTQHVQEVAWEIPAKGTTLSWLKRQWDKATLGPPQLEEPRPGGSRRG